MTDEHTVAIVSFEGAIKREIKRIREALKRDESLSTFQFTIRANGRVHDGDVKLSFSIAEDQYGSNVVEGDNAWATLEELMRRRGWKAVHAPTAIGYERIPSDNTDDEEIPF